MKTDARRILLAVDLSIVRQSLKALLEQESFHVTADSEDGPEAIELARQRPHPDVAILDSAVSGMSVIEAGRELNRMSPPVPWIMLADSDEELNVMQTLRAGARGYLLKSANGAEMIQAVRAVLQGGVYISPKACANLVPRLLAAGDLASHPLTDNEKEVVKLVVEGMKAEAAAAMLGIAPREMGHHRRRIMQKLHVRNTAGLVRYAVRHRIVSA